jgi:Fe2+ transport system protein A
MINTIKHDDKNVVSGKSCSASGLRSSKICKLDTLGASQRATVIGLNASNDLQGRLMGMGLTIGATVEVLQKGRFKPLLISVGESRIALGYDIANMVLVESGEPNSGENP